MYARLARVSHAIVVVVLTSAYVLAITQKYIQIPIRLVVS